MKYLPEVFAGQRMVSRGQIQRADEQVQDAERLPRL
jgi:hypothetical protein